VFITASLVVVLVWFLPAKRKVQESALKAA
jgi:hypothetical protein